MCEVWNQKAFDYEQNIEFVNSNDRPGSLFQPGPGPGPGSAKSAGTGILPGPGL